MAQRNSSLMGNGDGSLKVDTTRKAGHRQSSSELRGEKTLISEEDQELLNNRKQLFR